MPTDDATLAGELRHLARAFDQHATSLLGPQARPICAADHCLCLGPVKLANLPLDTLPHPYLSRPATLGVGRKAGAGSLIPDRRRWLAAVCLPPSRFRGVRLPITCSTPLLRWGQDRGLLPEVVIDRSKV